MSQSTTLSSSNNFQTKGHEGMSTSINNKKMIMWAFLASDCMFFGTLISTHLIYRKLFPGDIPLKELTPVTKIFSVELTTFSTFILLISSFFMALAVSAMHKEQIKSFRNNVLRVLLFGLIFLGCQVYEFYEFVHIKGMTLSNTLFGSTFFFLTGTHGCHVAIGILWLFSLYAYSFTGKMTHEQATDVEVAGLYWHFVDIVWLIIFPVVYLIEYVGQLT